MSTWLIKKPMVIGHTLLLFQNCEINCHWTSTYDRQLLYLKLSLRHICLPAIIPTFDLYTWKLMRQMWLGINFFCGKRSSVGKKSKFGELSKEEIQEITDKVRNENNQRYVPI